MLLPQIQRSIATRIAEKLRLQLADLSSHTSSELAPFTCSFGVAELTPELDSFDTLLSAADKALYRAKSAGRKRVMD